MSKHNYSQYSNNKKNANIDETVVDETVVVEETVSVEETPVIVEETPVEVVPTVEVDSGKKRVKSSDKPSTTTGTVTNCVKLNVRINPNTTAEVVCVLDVNTEVEIDVAKSNKDWFKVCTATGIEGYCMRKFVEASL